MRRRANDQCAEYPSGDIATEKTLNMVMSIIYEDLLTISNRLFLRMSKVDVYDTPRDAHVILEKRNAEKPVMPSIDRLHDASTIEVIGSW